MKDVEEEEEVNGESKSRKSMDICDCLMQRYKSSSAPQHRHLCAAAAAMRSILLQESLPTTPAAYFAATISAIHTSASSPHPDEIAALCTFLSILLPLVPPDSLPPFRSADATSVLVGLLRTPSDPLSTATVRSVIKSLGYILPFCGTDDWSVVKLSLKILLEFSVDPRPKVRRYAHVCLEKLFKTFGSLVLNKASKMVLCMFNDYLPLAIEFSQIKIGFGPENQVLLSPKHREVLHLLNSLKFIFPFLPEKFISKLLTELYTLLSCHFSVLTQHIFDILKVFLELPKPGVLISEAENIIASILSYISCSDNNPADITVSALTLLKCGMDKLHGAKPNVLIKNLPLVFNSLAGLLNSESNIAILAADILKDLISHHFDGSFFKTTPNKLCNASFMSPKESAALESICSNIVNSLNTFESIPNEHTLAVISDLFCKLGHLSEIFMKEVVLKLAEYMVFEDDIPGMMQLQECIGSAVVALGVENILPLVPISLNSEELTCSNSWLIPILRKYVVGSSLGYYMENIVPLAKSIQEASSKVKMVTRVQDLQTCARGLWELLPAFCRYPVDTSQNFKRLVEILMVILQEDSSLHEIVAASLQELVNQNISIVRSNQHTHGNENEKLPLESEGLPSLYSKKTAMKNMKALASSSMDLLHALTVLFFKSPVEKRLHLKDAIGCLASISERSRINDFFTSLEESMNLDADVPTFANQERGGEANRAEQVEVERYLIIELASSLVKGADEEFINKIYHYIRPSLLDPEGNSQSEAYCTLSRIFEEHAWFYTTRSDEIMDLLFQQKYTVHISSKRNRFACFEFLLVDILKHELGECTAKAFQILNEIILTLKDSNEEIRRAGYDILLVISSKLKSLPSTYSDAPRQRLFGMIIGYLSCASPHITSGAVAALSLLIYEDPSLCFYVPNLMPAVLVLLQSKANEVIKAVLGFTKVIVSCLNAKELKIFMNDIVSGILPWSSISKNHFRSKVKIIMEIIQRKCGSDAVQSAVPEKYKGFFKKFLEAKHSKTNGNGSVIRKNKADPLRSWKQKVKRHLSLVPAKENVSKGFASDRTEKRRMLKTNSSEHGNSSVRGDEKQSISKTMRPFVDKKRKIRDNQLGGEKRKNGKKQKWEVAISRDKKLGKAQSFSKVQKLGSAQKQQRRV